jgi:hypothetical protein
MMKSNGNEVIVQHMMSAMVDFIEREGWSQDEVKRTDGDKRARRFHVVRQRILVTISPKLF